MYKIEQWDEQREEGIFPGQLVCKLEMVAYFFNLTICSGLERFGELKSQYKRTQLHQSK